MSEKSSSNGLPLEARLSYLVGFLLTSMPLHLPFWAWRFWYLRPLLLYASVLPYMFAALFALNAVPYLICFALGIFEKYEKSLVRFSLRCIWIPYMRLWHGYEVTGLENLPPRDKGGLIVFYHGAMPIDAVFVGAAIVQHQGRLITGSAHRGTLKIPIVGKILRANGFTDDGREKMIENLKNGTLAAVSPGADYETMFSENYSVEFGNRCGFAVVAKEAGVPVIPMFTENLREHLRCHFFGFRSYIRKLHSKYRTAVIWCFGGLPVKLRTHLGKPLYCGENETAQEFAKRIVKAIEELRDANQKLDNSIIRALMDRFKESDDSKPAFRV